MSTVKKIMMASASGGSYWLNQFQDTGYRAEGAEVKVDSNDVPFIAGQLYGNQGGLVARFDSSTGDMTHHCLQGDSDTAWYGLTFDSSNNVYVGGTTNSGSNKDIAVAKYSNDLSTQLWRNQLTYSSKPFYMGASPFDGSNNIYTDGSSVWTGASFLFGSNYWPVMIKWNASTGALTYDYGAPGASGSHFASGVHKVGSYLYWFYWGYTGSGNQPYLVRTTDNYSPSIEAHYGVTQGTLAYGMSYKNNFYSNADFIWCGEDYTYKGGILIALNDSGTVVWTRRAKISSTSYMHLDAVKISDTNDVYAVGWYGQSSDQHGVILKYSSSGTLQWATKIYSKLSTYNAFAKCAGIDIDSNGDIYITGSGPDHFGSNQYGRNGFLLKIPPNASVTGTYGNYTFSDITSSVTTDTTNATKTNVNKSVTDFGGTSTTTSDLDSYGFTGNTGALTNESITSL